MTYLMIVLLVVTALGMLKAGILGAYMSGCPYCRKGIKLFATHCHHCGRDVRLGRGA
jgi:hypothetical protein